METGFMNRIIGLALALVVGGLLVGGLLIPSIEGMTATEKTFENEGYYNLIKIDDTTTTTLTWDPATGSKVSVDGAEINIPSATGRLTLIGSDSLCVRIDGGTQIQVYGSYSGSQDYKGVTTAVTISIANGTVTVNDGATKTFDLGNDAFIIAPADVESDYVAVMKLSNESAHVLKDSEIICCGISVSNQYKKSIGVFGKGTVENMEFSSFYTGSDYTGDTTITDVVIHNTEVTNYIDLYELEKFTFTLNYNEGTTSDITYSYFIVPASVTAELSQHLDATQIAMFGVISILGIVALVVLAANGIRNKY